MLFIHPFLNQLGNTPMLDTLTKEIVGVNLPRVALTRSADERLDVAASAIGNTAAAFGVGGLLNWGLNRIYGQAAKADDLAGRWARLGRSAAIFSAVFSLMWAMPFVRNYITARRTGSVQFTDVIGASASAVQSKSDLTTALSDYKTKALTFIGSGAAMAAAAILGTRLAMARNLNPGILKRFFNHAWLRENLLLKNGSFTDFSWLKALFFWGVPAYGGWIHASRDQYERREQLLKFGCFVAAFFGPQYLLARRFKQMAGKLLNREWDYRWVTAQLKQLAPDHPQRPALQKALSAWRKNTVGGLLLSIGLLGAIPQVLGMLLTRSGLKDKVGTPKASILSGNLPGILRRKPISEWGRR